MAYCYGLDIHIYKLNSYTPKKNNQYKLNKGTNVLVGVAIFARPASTEPDLTLMVRVLLGPIKNRVKFGFFFLKKKPETGLGRVQVLIKTQQVPDPTQPDYILKY